MTDGVTYLKVFDHQGAVCVMAGYEPRLDAAVTRWIDDGHDELVQMETYCGEMYKILASQVTSMLLSTSEGRRNEMLAEAALKEEEATHRHEAGIWEDD
jgi:hypothetical protein